MSRVFTIAMLVAITLMVQGCGTAAFYCMNEQPTPAICKIP